MHPFTGPHFLNKAHSGDRFEMLAESSDTANIGKPLYGGQLCRDVAVMTYRAVLVGSCANAHHAAGQGRCNVSSSLAVTATLARH